MELNSALCSNTDLEEGEILDTSDLLEDVSSGDEIGSSYDSRDVIRMHSPRRRPRPRGPRPRPAAKQKTCSSDKPVPIVRTVVNLGYRRDGRAPPSPPVIVLEDVSSGEDEIPEESADAMFGPPPPPDFVPAAPVETTRRKSDKSADVDKPPSSQDPPSRHEKENRSGNRHKCRRKRASTCQQQQQRGDRRKKSRSKSADRRPACRCVDVGSSKARKCRYCIADVRKSRPVVAVVPIPESSLIARLKTMLGTAIGEGDAHEEPATETTGREAERRPGDVNEGPPTREKGDSESSDEEEALARLREAALLKKREGSSEKREVNSEDKREGSSEERGEGDSEKREGSSEDKPEGSSEERGEGNSEKREGSSEDKREGSSEERCERNSEEKNEGNSEGEPRDAPDEEESLAELRARALRSNALRRQRERSPEHDHLTELRLEALRSAVLKRHVARKRRRMGVALEPSPDRTTDVVDMDLADTDTEEDEDNLYRPERWEPLNVSGEYETLTECLRYESPFVLSDSPPGEHPPYAMPRPMQSEWAGTSESYTANVPDDVPNRSDFGGAGGYEPGGGRYEGVRLLPVEPPGSDYASLADAGGYYEREQVPFPEVRFDAEAVASTESENEYVPTEQRFESSASTFAPEPPRVRYDPDVATESARQQSRSIGVNPVPKRRKLSVGPYVRRPVEITPPTKNATGGLAASVSSKTTSTRRPVAVSKNAVRYGANRWTAARNDPGSLKWCKQRSPVVAAAQKSHFKVVNASKKREVAVSESGARFIIRLGDDSDSDEGPGQPAARLGPDFENCLDLFLRISRRKFEASEAAQQDAGKPPPGTSSKSIKTASRVSVNAKTPSPSVIGKAMHAKVAPTNVTPAQATPTIVAPANVTPVTVMPVKAMPAKVTPAKVTPTKATPTNVTPANVAPTKAAPTNVTPANVTPVTVMPVKAMPAKVTPAKATATNVTPAKAAPANVMPVEAMPAKMMPAKVTPAKVTPTKATPAKAKLDQVQGKITQPMAMAILHRVGATRLGLVKPTAPRIAAARRSAGVAKRGDGAANKKPDTSATRPKAVGSLARRPQTCGRQTETRVSGRTPSSSPTVTGLFEPPSAVVTGDERAGPATRSSRKATAQQRRPTTVVPEVIDLTPSLESPSDAAERPPQRATPVLIDLTPEDADTEVDGNESREDSTVGIEKTADRTAEANEELCTSDVARTTALLELLEAEERREARCRAEVVALETRLAVARTCLYGQTDMVARLRARAVAPRDPIRVAPGLSTRTNGESPHADLAQPSAGSPTPYSLEWLRELNVALERVAAQMGRGAERRGTSECLEERRGTSEVLAERSGTSEVLAERRETSEPTCLLKSHPRPTQRYRCPTLLTDAKLGQGEAVNPVKRPYVSPVTRSSNSDCHSVLCPFIFKSSCQYSVCDLRHEPLSH